MSYHLTPVGMAGIKKIRANMYQHGCGHEQVSCPWWQEYELMQPFWKTVGIPQTVISRTVVAVSRLGAHLKNKENIN